MDPLWWPAVFVRSSQWLLWLQPILMLRGARQRTPGGKYPGYVVVAVANQGYLGRGAVRYRPALLHRLIHFIRQQDAAVFHYSHTVTGDLVDDYNSVIYFPNSYFMSSSSSPRLAKSALTMAVACWAVFLMAAMASAGKIPNAASASSVMRGSPRSSSLSVNSTSDGRGVPVCTHLPYRRTSCRRLFLGRLLPNQRSGLFLPPWYSAPARPR